MLLKKRNLTYNQHCKYAFGSYVQAAEEHAIKNDNKPRTIDAIYLEPNMSPSGGHFVMNLKTGAKMHKGRVWELPITESVIQAVESLAKSQGYTSLKLKGKNKTQLLPIVIGTKKRNMFMARTMNLRKTMTKKTKTSNN